MIDNKEGNSMDLYLYGDIGPDGITAKQVKDQLAGWTGPVDVHISSSGGDVFEGVSIHNFLKGLPGPVTVYIDGVAASIASVIAMAGSRVLIAPTASMMVHECGAQISGTSATLARGIAVLQIENTILASIYAERAGGTAEQWRARMAAETWFSAAEAVKVGLADGLIQHRPLVGSVTNRATVAGRQVVMFSASTRLPRDPMAGMWWQMVHDRAPSPAVRAVAGSRYGKIRASLGFATDEAPLRQRPTAEKLGPNTLRAIGAGIRAGIIAAQIETGLRFSYRPRRD